MYVYELGGAVADSGDDADSAVSHASHDDLDELNIFESDGYVSDGSGSHRSGDADE